MKRSKILLLCGGVGGSRLADGFARILGPDKLTIVVNTADDFDHLGLRICPDLDTVTYMMAGLVDQVRGWGRADETWACMETLERLGGETWFQLGDRDLALHLQRTALLGIGVSLSEITRAIASTLGLRHVPVPMSNDSISTVIETDEGDHLFQDYFVRLRCAPRACAVRYNGVERARPSPGLTEALADPALMGIVIAPSNPFLSIGPILAIPRVRTELRAAEVPIIAVSPIIAGKAVKGPAAKLLAELGYEPEIEGVAAYYEGLLDALVVDDVDRERGRSLRLRCHPAQTLMTDPKSRAGLAEVCLELIAHLGRAPRQAADGTSLGEPEKAP